MNDNEYQSAFSLIALAGDSKSDSMRAINQAKQGHFKESEELLKSAEEKLNQAHIAQYELIQKEANGEKVPVNIVLIHAQDHVTMALIMKDMAAEFINMYKKLLEKDDK